MTQCDMENSLVKKVMEKTIFYDLESFIPQEDGTVKHFHSDRFLDEHPERKDTPNFTEEEEQEQIDFLAKIAFKMAKDYGSLFSKKNK